MTKRHRQLDTQRADLVRRRTDLSTEGRTISERCEKESRLQSDEERARVTAILAELDEIKPKVAAIDAEIATEEQLEAHERTSILAGGGTSGGGTLRPGGFQASDEFTGMGEFLQAIAVASDPVFRQRLGDKSAVLMSKLAAYQAAGTGMSVGVPSDGGYLVRKDWTTAMLQRARAQAQILPLCRDIPIGADFDGLEYPYIDETSRVDGSRWGGVQVFWKAEAATVTAKQPKIGKGELRLEEIMGLAYATERLLRDSTALEGLLGQAFEEEFAFKIDDAILRGTGSGQPLGIFVSPVLVTQAAEGGQTSTTVNVDNVLKMYARMPARLKPGAVWLIHADVMTQLPKMVIGQQPVWLPPGALANESNGRLLGKPVIEIEQAAALGQPGDITLANFSQYAVITKAGEGLRYDTSMHVRFLNDEQVFRWVFRINGQPTWRTSLTPYKGSSTLSPFINLATR